jgi:hypothetical protein
LRAEGKTDEAAALLARMAAEGYSPAADELAEMKKTRREG